MSTACQAEISVTPELGQALHTGCLCQLLTGWVSSGTGQLWAQLGSSMLCLHTTMLKGLCMVLYCKPGYILHPFIPRFLPWWYRENNFCMVRWVFSDSLKKHFFAVLVLYLLKSPAKRIWGIAISLILAELWKDYMQEHQWCDIEADAENKLDQRMCLMSTWET